MQLQDKGSSGDSAPVLHTFRLTFHQKYRNEYHPLFVRGRLDFDPHPDGWVTILAVDEVQARVIARDRLVLGWAFLYDAADWAVIPPKIWVHMHPAGELAVWDQILNPEDDSQ